MMSSVRFHAFLPPSLLPLTDFKPDSDLPDRLAFLEFPPIVIETLETQSQKRNSFRPLTQLIPPGQGIRATAPEKVDKNEVNDETGKSDEDEVMSWEDSVILPKVPIKRKSDTLDEPDLVPSLPDKSVYNASRALGPRRSTRISRTSDAFTNAAPGLDATESFLSLNTTATISQQSQPPLPNWSIPLLKLVSLQSLLSGRALRRYNQQNDSQRVSLMVCVMAVEAPVKRQRKEEKVKKEEGTLWIGGWKVTVPPIDAESGGGGGEEVACTVKLWDEMAREWGDEVIRRGDVVLLENVEFRPSTPKDPASITISSGPKSSHQPKISILYRTLPRRAAGRGDYLPPRTSGKTRNFAQAPVEGAGPDTRIVAEDEALRPDLRLSRSDAGVRKVADWARWFSNWVGGEPP